MKLKLPEWLTKKEGPLPVWGYFVIGAAGYVAWRWYEARNAASSTQSTGINSPQPVYSNGGGAAGGSGTSSPTTTPLSCPTNFALDPTGSTCLPTAAYLTSLLPTPTSTSQAPNGNPTSLVSAPSATVPIVPAGGIPANPTVGSTGLGSQYAGYQISPQENTYLTQGPAAENALVQSQYQTWLANNPQYGQSSAALPSATTLTPAASNGGYSGNSNNALGVPVSNPNIPQMWNGYEWVPI